MKVERRLIGAAMLLLAAVGPAASGSAQGSGHGVGGPIGPKTPISPSRAPLYEIMDLGTLGGSTSAANDINDSGHVVGWAESSTGLRWGFLWMGTQMYSLRHWTNEEAEALALSNHLEETCGWGLSSGNRRALIWVFDLIADLGTFGGEEAVCHDLNNVGGSAGWAQNAAGHHRAFRESSYAIVELGTLGGDNAEAHGINDSWQIVGWSELAPDSDPGRVPLLEPRHACRWWSSNILDLGTLGGPSSAAEGINESGQVVGAADTGGSDPAYPHAFLWLPAPAYGWNAGMHDLGTLPQMPTSKAWNLNDADEIVGESGTADATATRAFRWDPINGMLDLNDRLVTGEDWVLLSARSVNSHGQIVGSGLHGGVLRAYLLTPLE